jgi:hypothetical protein
MGAGNFINKSKFLILKKFRNYLKITKLKIT